MIDSFDYKEPRCTLCGGKEFYNFKENSSLGRIPVERIINKVDECFNKNDYNEAGRILEYWANESVSLKDLSGELSMLSELVGFYRKINDSNKGMISIKRALELVNELNQQEMASGATVYLNCATAYKAFGEVENAIKLYAKAEEIYIKVLSSNDERFGGLYNNMALTLVDLKEYEKAEQCYKKAISVMEKINNGQADLAITYVNMAHLYEVLDKKKVLDCLFTAYELLNTESLVKNGYYAYVCEKCAPSFEYFGYQLIADELRKLSGEIYERA